MNSVVSRGRNATPRNVVVVGAPRSGTSMVAGLFVAAGHDPGRKLILPSPANPTGFHEDLDVNALNDDLLERGGARTPWADTRIPPRRLLWLAALVPELAPAAEADLCAMRSLLGRQPFVLKDPRFSYTFPLWSPVLNGAVVVCVFRSPAEVAGSLLRMAEREPKTFEGFVLTFDHGVRAWEAMHRSILGWADDRVVFVAHEDVLRGSALDLLGTRTGSALDDSAIHPALHVVRSDRPVPRSVAELHTRLLDRSDRARP